MMQTIVPVAVTPVSVSYPELTQVAVTSQRSILGRKLLKLLQIISIGKLL